MIKLSKLQISGFRGVRDPLEITFSGAFTVLTGPNGAGKSSVLDAIEFALSGGVSKYGERAGEKGETISDYEWWRGANPPAERFVRLELIDEQGTRTTVTRRPQGTEIEGSEQSILDLLCDRKQNPESTIEELCRTSLIRDEFIAKNSVDLPETERFSFVREAVGGHSPGFLLKKLADAEKILVSRVGEASRLYDSARNRVQSAVEQLAAAKGQATQELSRADAEKSLRGLLGIPTSDAAHLLSTADAEINRLRTRVGDLNSLLSKAIVASQRRNALEHDGTAAKRVELDKQVAVTIEEHARVDKALEDQNRQVDALRRTERFMADLAQLHTAGKSIGRRADQCPLCGSRIDETSFRKHLGEIDKEISDQGLQIRAALEEQSQLRHQRERLADQLERAALARDRLKAEIDAAEKQWQEFRAEALKFNPDYSDVSLDGMAHDLDAIKSRLSLVEQNRRALMNSDLTERIVDLERDVQTRREASVAAEKEITKFRRAESQLQEATRAIKRASAEAVEERLAAIQPLFTELYSRLRPHMDWRSVSYTIRGDVRRYLSLQVDENLNLKFLFSSGQRRVTGLAFLISVALSRPWCRLKTLILDDPVQHVDDFRAIHLVETLSAIRRMDYQLICSVEENALADLLGRRLRSSYAERGTLVHMKYVSGEGAKVDSIQTIPPFEQVISLAS